MQKQDLKQLTLFPEVSLANPSVWLESKKEREMIVTYGRKCLGLSEKLSQLGFLVRMYLESCELPLPTLYRTWSVKDLNASCLILKLRLSARATEGSGYSLWATPNTMDHLPPRSPEALQRQAQGARKGRTRPANLREQVDEQTMRMWPTLTASDYVNRSAINPVVCPATGLIRHRNKSGGTSCARLEPVVKFAEKRTMPGEKNPFSLNPDWVEWLMGFPISWTDIGK